MQATCPICYKKFPSDLLERHVNTCLDTQETSSPNSISDGASNHETHTLKSTTPTPEDDIIEVEKASRKPSTSQNPFAALGLKLDSGPKRKGSENGKSKNIKEKATLTSILIAERRLKRKQEALDSLEKKDDSQSPPMKLQRLNSVHGIASTQTNISKPIIKTPPPQSNSQDVVDITSPIKSPPKSQALRKNQEFMRIKREAALPLAQRLRPKSLDDFFGQEKLVGENGLLRNIINADQIPSFLLWGVPGVGKTSLARIIATNSSYKFVEISGVDGNTKKLREAFQNAENETHLTGRKTILFLDEIHRFNKAVQDLLLPVIEKGIVTVIGATTENPSFTLNNALLSRMHTFIMDPLPHEALVKIINKGLFIVNRTRSSVHKLHLIALSRSAIDYIAKLSTGDSRVALNILESINAYLSGIKYQFLEENEKLIKIPDDNGKIGVIKVTSENLKPLLSTKNYHQMYDKQGESHYDTISAFHKSIRGSDANAAMFYLVKMLSGGEDPLFIARRMIVIASEDIGLRDSSCLPFTLSVLEAIKFVGMPEGEIILAHCTIKLARALKSTKSYRALNTAKSLLKENPDVTKLPIPLHLRNAPTKLMKDLGYSENYKYNPNFKYGKNKQYYFPYDLNEQDTKFIEDTHLGSIEDEEVPRQEYNKLMEEDKEYQEFKKFRRDKLRSDFLMKKVKTKINNKKRIEKRREEEHGTQNVGDDYSYSDTQVDEEMNQESDEDNDGEVNQTYSYDEFLSKEDQPEYFDCDDTNTDDVETENIF